MADALVIQKLTKRRTNLRMAIIGPTGSGKTYTALKLARDLSDRPWLVIDTEHDSAGLYALELNPDGRFDHLSLPDYNPETYKNALRMAAEGGYDVIVDSLSHAWAGREGILEQVDKAAKRSNSGSSFSAWRDVTPLHNSLVETLLAYPGNLIVTMRVKTEYIVEQVNGKGVPRKVGLQPQQRDGLEYEFDIVGDMDEANNFSVSKTRCKALGGALINKPGYDLAKTIREWLEAGVPEDVSDPKEVHRRLMLRQEDDETLKRLCHEQGRRYQEALLEAWRLGLRSFTAIRDWLNGSASGPQTASETPEVPDTAPEPSATGSEPQTASETPEAALFGDERLSDFDIRAEGIIRKILPDLDSKVKPECAKAKKLRQDVDAANSLNGRTLTDLLLYIEASDIPLKSGDLLSYARLKSIPGFEAVVSEYKAKLSGAATVEPVA